MSEHRNIFLEPTTNAITIVMENTLKHEDYLFLNEAFEKAIENYEKKEIDVLIDALRLTGWELEAAWDDLKFGLKYDKTFRRIAFVGNKPWERYTVKVSNWFMHTEIQYFETLEEAKSWLAH